jgi:hypothetical protein
MYPGSFPVAVALHRAADNGVIDAAALDATNMGTAHYDDAVHRLQEFGRALAVSPVAKELPASFSLGYVDSQLWTRYSQFDGKIRVDIHTDGPVEGEAVVLTGEPVLTELFAGSLSVDRAMTDGVIIIEGNETEKATIRNALIGMSFANKITHR